LPSCKDVGMSMPTPEDCAASADELRAVVEELNAVIQRLDAFDMEDAEVMSLRLQMAMDRLSKSRSTLSNILK
jgi:tRNA C32,U32 (ribose-2'-O)-methylase TrmJ